MQKYCLPCLPNIYLLVLATGLSPMRWKTSKINTIVQVIYTELQYKTFSLL